MNLDICVVPPVVTNFLPKLLNMLLFSTGKKLNFHLLNSPIFGYCHTSLFTQNNNRPANTFSTKSSFDFYLKQEAMGAIFRPLQSYGHNSQNLKLFFWANFLCSEDAGFWIVSQIQKTFLSFNCGFPNSCAGPVS